jgi:hypothetical protein
MPDVTFVPGDPDALDKLATAFGDHAGTLTRYTDGLDSIVADLTKPKCWVSAAGRAFVSSWDKDRDTGRKIITDAGDGQTALAAYTRALRGIQGEARDLERTARQDNLYIGTDGTVIWQHPHQRGLPPEDQNDINKEYEQKHADAKRRVEGEVSRIRGEWRTALTTLGSALSGPEADVRPLVSQVPWNLPSEYDQKKVDDAYNLLMNGGDLKQLKGLTGPELDALFGKLSPDERAAFLDWMRMADRSEQGLDLENYLLTHADLGTLAALGLSRPNYTDTEPYIKYDYKDWDPRHWFEDGHPGPLHDGHYQDLGLPLFGPDGAISVNDVKQQQLNDCYFLSAAGAVAVTNPELIRRNMRLNPNGTVTVTFYQNGRPVQVTVTPDLPVDKNGNTVFAGTGTDDWPAIYEKAYAQYQGDYGNLDHGGNSADVMADLTGKPSHQASPNDYHSVADIQKMIDSGHPVTVGTPKDNDLIKSANKGLHTWHAYIVTGTTPDGKLILKNPWGYDDPQPVTIDELHKYFTSVNTTE